MGRICAVSDVSGVVVVCASRVAVNGDHVATPPVTLRHFDLMTMKQADVNFSVDFRLELLPSSQAQSIYGAVIWFDVDFSKRVRRS